MGNQNLRAWKRVIVLGLLPMAAACSKTNSSNVKTSGIYVTYTIEGNNQNSAVCRAQFQVGGSTGTFLDLDNGDTVTCQGQSMSRSEFAGIVTYYAAVTYNPGGTYVVNFSRTGEPLYTASVAMPLPIAGMSPASFRTYQKNQAFTISWTPSLSGADSLTAWLSFDTSNSSYSSTKSGGQPEIGTVGFAAQDTVASPPTAGTYDGKIEYDRSRGGVIPSPLSGSIRAHQIFTVPIQLVD